MGRFATVTAVVCAVLLAGILPAKVAQARNKGQTGPALEKSKGAAPSAASHKLSGPVKWGLIAGTGFFVGSMALGAAASTAVVAAAVGAAGVGAVGGSWEMRRMKPIPKKDPATDAATAQQPAGTWQSLKAGFGKATGWIGNKKDKAVQATQDFESKLGDYAAGLQNSPPERGTVPAT